jgi:O-antigen chain-terminating methyltransferase
MSHPQFENPDSKSFYLVFQDRHRGSREMTKGRLQQYAPFLTPLLDIHPQGHVLDLGCGRGEWLEVTRELGIHACGLELDAGMFSARVEIGLDARQEDLLDALTDCADEGLHVVSAFHLVEHIAFQELRAVMCEELRLLVLGAMLILETPNPENLVVGTNILSRAHAFSLHAALLMAIFAEFSGFSLILLKRMHLIKSNFKALTISIDDSYRRATWQFS